MSITNFEDLTYELTEKETEILPFIVSGFSRYSKEEPIKSDKIVARLNTYLKEKGYKIKVDGVRLRKFVNYIRANGLLPLIATSNGYYVSTDKEEIEKQIKSLKERARSIMTCANGLDKFITN